jgi:hypothetical protein
MMRKHPYVRIALEMLAMFGCLGWLDYRLGGAFVQFNPNPYWIPVIGMAVTYGSGSGLFAAILASGWWIASQQVPLSPGDDPFDHLLHMSLTPLLWVLAAICIGELTAYRRSKLCRLLDARAKLERDISKLSSAFDLIMVVNRDLQVRVAMGDNETAEVMASTIALTKARPSKFAEIAAHLIGVTCREDDFTYYMVEGTTIRPLTRGIGATRPLRSIEGSALAHRLLSGEHSMLAAEEDGWALFEDIGVAALAIRSPGNITIGILLFHSLQSRSPSRLGLLELADATGGLGEAFAQLSPSFLKLACEDDVPVIRNRAM